MKSNHKAVYWVCRSCGSLRIMRPMDSAMPICGNCMSSKTTPYNTGFEAALVSDRIRNRRTI
jgi:hypothetical protein